MITSTTILAVFGRKAIFLRPWTLHPRDPKRANYYLDFARASYHGCYHP